MEKLFKHLKRRKATVSFDRRKNQSRHQVASYRRSQTGPFTFLTLRRYSIANWKCWKACQRHGFYLLVGKQSLRMQWQVHRKVKCADAKCQTLPPAFQTRQVIGNSGISGVKMVSEATKFGWHKTSHGQGSHMARAQGLPGRENAARNKRTKALHIRDVFC